MNQARYVYECLTPGCKAFEQARVQEPRFEVSYTAKNLYNQRGQLEVIEGSLDGNPPFAEACDICSEKQAVTIEVFLPGVSESKHVVKLQ